MRKYLKPMAKFHELKGAVILAGSGVETPGVQGKSINVGDTWTVDNDNARDGETYWK